MRSLSVARMPINSERRLSRRTGISLSLSLSAADEIGKTEKQKQENWKGSVVKSPELNKNVECGVPVCCSKRNGVIKSTRSIKSRPRSVSPPKNRVSYDWEEFSSIEIEEERGDSKNDKSDDLSRKQRTSRRWNLRDLLYRSRSEGSTQRKEREKLLSPALPPARPSKNKNKPVKGADQLGAGKPINGGPTKANLTSPCASPKVKLTSPPASPNQSLKSNKKFVTKNGGARSSHELYYQTNRAQAEELKRRSFLPYRRALLGCLGPFPSITSNQHALQLSTC